MAAATRVKGEGSFLYEHIDSFVLGTYHIENKAVVLWEQYGTIA